MMSTRLDYVIEFLRLLMARIALVEVITGSWKVMQQERINPHFAAGKDR